MNIFIASILILGTSTIGAHKPPSKDQWTLETNEFPTDERFRPTIANGYLGTVVYHENIHVTGIYNGIANATTPNETSTHCRIPNPIAFRLRLPEGVEYKSKFQLKLFEGFFMEQIDTSDWQIRIRHYAHQIYKTLLVADVSGRPKHRNPSPLTVSLEKLTLPDSKITDMQILDSRSEDGKSFVKYRPLIQENPDVASPVLAVVSTDVPDQIEFSAHSKPHWAFLMAVVVNSADADAYGDLENGLKLTQKDLLFLQHVGAWRTIWTEGGRIDIQGNDDLAQTVHSAMYYLLSSSPTDPYDEDITHEWPNFGLSPASLAHSDIIGQHYYGHIFWDQETWMLPALVPFQPNVIRRILIDSRIRRLTGAQQKATDYGLDGAMFPWEVGYSGIETCNWEPGAAREIHITGDIVQFVRQYLYWTDDVDFLAESGGYDLLYQAAQFWESRTSWLPDRQGFGVLDVVGPDEYHDHVNNSIYTNAIAALSLRLPGEFYSRLHNGSKTYLEPVANWTVMAERMDMPFDSRMQCHLEYDGYENGTQIKQADVVLLGYPLLLNMTDSIRRNDLELYGSNTSPDGPCMTWAIHSISWLDLSEEQKAYEDFQRNFLNINGPFKIWTESADGSGAVNFITGIGGFLQNILYGYLGLRVHADRLDFNPKTIPETNGYVVSNVKYMGIQLTFTVKTDQIQLTVRDASVLQDRQCNLYAYASGSSVTLGDSTVLVFGKYAVMC